MTEKEFRDQLRGIADGLYNLHCNLDNDNGVYVNAHRRGELSAALAIVKGLHQRSVELGPEAAGTGHIERCHHPDLDDDIPAERCCDRFQPCFAAGEDETCDNCRYRI